MTTTRVLLGVWLLCVAATAAAGLWLQVGISIAFALIVGLLVMLTARVTDPDYGIFVAPKAPGTQLAISALAFLGTSLLALRIYGYATVSLGAFDRLPLYARNALSAAIVPAVLLVPFGLRPRDLGFGLPRRGLVPAMLIWCCVPTAIIVYGIVARHASVADIAIRTATDVLQNGFAEEILFRGLVFAAFAAFSGVEWGNCGQALAFGLWHLPASLDEAHGNLVIAAAVAVAENTILAYGLGTLMRRTGNVVAGGVFHTLIDTWTVALR